MLQTISFILGHPLNRGRKFAALKRFVSWQLSSRLTPGKIALPFIDNTRLLMRRGMHGATGNYYCGLHEFEDMAFVLHALLPGELFVDIGANIGSYSILAAGAAQASVLCAEPSPATFQHLLDNIHLNRLEGRIEALNVALGQKTGQLQFTTGLDTVNHVVSAGESQERSVTIDVRTLDDIVSDYLARRAALSAPAVAGPSLIKIDVEGFETEVIGGASQTLRNPALLALILELTGEGARYGYDEKAIHQTLLDLGFAHAAYDPRTRALSVGQTTHSNNSLYVRQPDVLAARLLAAPKRTVNGATF